MLQVIFLGSFRLLRIFWVLFRHGILGSVLEGKLWFFFYRIASSMNSQNPKKRQSLVQALMRLGPIYVKLGQFLATRPDIVGFSRMQELLQLQDKMPFFPQDQVRQVIESTLQKPLETLYISFQEPTAAASIAQVHQAQIQEGDASPQYVAVKIIRPGIESHFVWDIALFKKLARLGEHYIKSLKRLRLPEVLDTFLRSLRMEMDLRMEGAALCEIAKNTAGDEGFRVPWVDWARSGRSVLTMEWIDGIPVRDRQVILDAGHDPARLARILVQSFLRQAMRDGFFHADLHQGNLLVDLQGNLVAIDFGIMGRIGLKERYFLAEILWGFIRRDYARIAAVHFEAGYVPLHHAPEAFAQALCAIGEPLIGRNARDISIAKLLGHLFEVTEQFDMETRPELLLLQKSMLVVEGVARFLDPDFNMWLTAEPVVEEWMESHLGTDAALQGVTQRLVVMNRFLARLPDLLECSDQIIRHQAALSSRQDIASKELPVFIKYAAALGIIILTGMAIFS